jgi:2-dehydro-3-deoxyphosphogluconate aldolase/(4S)-4-hydroxy-2-oxoglutarate aldolase
VGMGSQLITKKIIAEKQFDVLTESVKNAMSIIQKLRG